MSRPPSLPSPILRARRESHRVLTPWAWRWLAFGAIASILSPDLRGYSNLIGWLPFWLLAAPAILLVLLHRDRIAAALSALLVGRRRRRTFARSGQARRARRPARTHAQQRAVA